MNGNGIFDGTEVNGEVAFSYNLPTQPGDSLAQDAQYTCMGSKATEGLGLQSLAIASWAELATWKANP